MTDLLLFWPWYSSRLQTPVRTGEGLVFRIADGPDLSSRGISICCHLGYPRLVVHLIRQSLYLQTLASYQEGFIILAYSTAPALHTKNKLLIQCRSHMVAYPDIAVGIIVGQRQDVARVTC